MPGNITDIWFLNVSKSKINAIIESLEIEKSNIKLELDEISSKIQKAYSNVSITQQNISHIKNLGKCKNIY